MVEDGPADLLEGIRDVFVAYKMLPPLETKYQYLDVVVKQLDKAFSEESGPLGVNENQALKTVFTVFMAYKKLNKWDPETASEILVEHLGRVFALNEKEPVKTNEETDQVEELDVSPCITPETSQVVHQTAVTPFIAPNSESLTFPVAHKVPSSCSLPSTSSDQSTVAGSSPTIPENDDLIQDADSKGRPCPTTVTDHPLERWGIVKPLETRPTASATKSRVTKRSRKRNRGPRIRKMAVCHYCSKTLRADLLAIHVRIHTGERPFSCQHCQAKYMTKTALNLHLKARERRFPCRSQPCCRSFALEHTRNHHELHHHDHNFSGQQETLANSVFSLVHEDFKDPDLSVLEIEGRRLDLYTPPPKKSRDRKPRLLKCEVCNSRFSNQHLLKSHMQKEHLDPLERPYVCEFCGRRFMKENHRLNHERLGHKRTGLYDCTECSSKFLSRKQLESHCESKHLDLL